MSRKILIVSSLCFIQFTFTLCCGCGFDSTQRRVEYTGLALQAVNTTGFQFSQITDTINRTVFGMILNLNYVLVNHNFRLTRTNFNTLLACSPPSPPDPSDEDAIRSIEILVTAVRTAQTSNVSSHFETTNPFDNSRLTVDKLPAIETKSINPIFRFALVKSESIPVAAIFTLNVYLKSGRKLSKQTAQINFHAER